MALSRFRHVLQDKILLTDTTWCFTVPDLPQTGLANDEGYVKSLSVVSNPNEQHITLTFIRVTINRAISERPLHSFIYISFDAFRLQDGNGEQAPFKDSASYVSRLLGSGVRLNGIHYNFYGHSQSQLKSKACVCMAGTKEEVNQAVDGLGDFSTMKTVAKKVKRIGLLFSTANIVMDVQASRYSDIPDIENDDYIFTDGCGFISRDLARMLTRKRPIAFRNRRYHPSVFQIRYRGYKGVLMLEPCMPPGIWIQFRKSMKKFSGGRQMGFAVVEFSKPYSYGYLNDEVILLLHSLDISTEILIKKQQAHLDVLNEANSDPCVAFRLLSSLGHHELAEKLLLDGQETVAKSISKIVSAEFAKMLNKRGEQKCRILVPRSRLLYGVCDPRDLLRPSECFVKVTLEDGRILPITNTWVLVARNPCLHPGDLQKFWAVHHPELDHLVDCIAFSTQGKRPAADLMSGGDLDGDMFFVCWDPDLIPSTVSEAAEYPGGQELIKFKPISHQDRIDYFASSSSIQLGRVKKLYLQWARLTGPMSSQCQQLNRLFSQCVDANRIKIPDDLSNLPAVGGTNTPLFILDVLHDAAGTYIQARQHKFSISESSGLEILEEILSDNTSSRSQFELAQLTLQWCQRNKALFEDFWLYFDPRKLSSEERIWLLAQLPPNRQAPLFIMNDLLHSDILSPLELRQFGLDHPRIRWRIVFTSEDGRLGELLSNINRAFPTYSRKLLVVHLHERLSLAIYIPLRIARAEECAVGQRVRLFSFPHSQKGDRSHRAVVPTKHDSRLYYDQNTLQLYENKRANTFVFLIKSQNDESRYRETQGRGERARLRQKTVVEGTNCDWRTSVALNKFSHGLARHIGRVNREEVSAAELYVISNDDTRSFQHLDLWLEQIDTTTVMRNFDPPDEAFELPRLDDFDWVNEPQSVVDVLRDKNFDSLSPLDDIMLVSRMLEITWEMSAFDLASEICRRCLTASRDRVRLSLRLDLITVMVNLFHRTPLLVVRILDIGPWADLPSNECEILRSLIPEILKALILSAGQVGRLPIEYLRRILQETLSLKITEYRDIVEIAALVISSPETAIGVLLEGFEACSTRILLDTPLKTEYLVRNLNGIALDHIEEAVDQAKAKSKDYSYPWKFEKPLISHEKGLMLESTLRIDAPKTVRPAKGDHVRFASIGEPSNMVFTRPFTFEALVEATHDSKVTFRCIRHPPAFYRKCSWNMTNCGSFVTTNAMLDAVDILMTKKKDCCRVFDQLFPRSSSKRPSKMSPAPHEKLTASEGLNPSQQNAVSTALGAPLTLIWGPPGTGKTHTISRLIQQLLKMKETGRILVTAPTHNAVDNVMRQFVKVAAQGPILPLRVSTDVHKVSKDLLHLTCDAMLGHELNSNFAARRKAQKQISASSLIFTTCVGAGLGLLRTESFTTVIIDEASQQTEPASLIPLVKGCKKAILVGDHVQLRATVRPTAATQGFDISLFERLWIEGGEKHENSVCKVMLDTQYRMHPTLCKFPSTEFYESKLLTDASCAAIAVPASDSSFEWPKEGQRAVFIQCSDPEDLGLKSKSNTGQANQCQEVVRKLRTPAESPQGAKTSANQPSIAILTPYTRQLTLIKKLIPDPDIKISTIDGFQGQEADIIIYVTVRCNVHGEVGFLRDLRRLNVAITRPRAGLIFIGDKVTLVAKKHEEGDEGEAARQWGRLIASCVEMKI